LRLLAWSVVYSGEDSVGDTSKDTGGIIFGDKNNDVWAGFMAGIVKNGGQNRVRKLCFRGRQVGAFSDF